MFERCAVCGRGVYTGTRCPKFEGVVHQEHCQGCEYHVEMFSHCRFREDTLDRARLLTAKEREKLRRERIHRAFMAAVDKADKKEASA